MTSSAKTPIQLSIVIPAFNEEGRLGATLLAINGWAVGHQARVEVVVVDDGSKDRTLEIARIWARATSDTAEVEPLILAEPHRGKGAAVARGMLAARGAVRDVHGCGSCGAAPLR